MKDFIRLLRLRDWGFSVLNAYAYKPIRPTRMNEDQAAMGAAATNNRLTAAEVAVTAGGATAPAEETLPQADPDSIKGIGTQIEVAAPGSGVVFPLSK